MQNCFSWRNIIAVFAQLLGLLLICVAVILLHMVCRSDWFCDLFVCLL